MPGGTKGSLDKAALQRVANHALQSKSVTIEKLSAYLYRTYRLRTSSSYFYLLKCQPSHNVRLLRHEEDLLELEASALQMISGKQGLSTARLIEYHSAVHTVGSQYIISGPHGGSILAEIEPMLSRSSLAAIDQSLGHYVRQVASVTGPAFGGIQQVSTTHGSQSWAKAFVGMLETVLRDAEDALISLPYDGLRDLVRKHRASLDKITQPRLTLLDLGADRNVVVDVKRSQVVGLLDFSTAVWGDPFMSDVFYKPTASFAEGFGKLPNRDAEERIRQYLYVLYHSLLSIVRQTYRPSEDEAELDARRDLTTAMRQLSAIAR